MSAWDQARDAFLLRLSDTLCSLGDPLEIQAAAARCLGEHLHANRAFYIDIVDEKEALIYRDFANGIASIAGHHAAESFGSETAARLGRGETVVINDVAADAASSGANGQSLAKAGVASCMVAPVLKEGHGTAAFAVHSATPRVWSLFEINLLEQTAQRTWTAVERAKASVAEKEALVREVHHRVKNNLQLTTSLINLQANQIEDGQVLALFDETRNRVYSIATAYELIYRSENHAGMNIAAYARQLVPEVLRMYDARERLQVRIDGDAATLDLDRAVPFGLLLNELVSNVCKHAFPAGHCGELCIRFGRENQNYVLTVSDDGVGLPAGLDYHSASSLGLNLIHMLAQQLGGGVTVEPGPGVRIRVSFPVTHAVPEDGE